MLTKTSGVFLALILSMWPVASQAAVLSSPNFRLDPNVAGTFGGQTSSPNYKLTDVGGETAVGSGSSGSYKLTSGYVSQLEQAIQMNVQPTGIKAYYPLDTNVGTAIYDVSANNSQGAFVNTPTWAAGKIGNSLNITGTNRATAPVSLASEDDWTYEAWFYPTANATTSHSIISEGGSITAGLYWGVFGSGTNRFCLQYSWNSYVNTARACSTGTYSLNSWYHVVGVVNNMTSATPSFEIFVNGSSVDTNSIAQAGDRPASHVIGDPTNGMGRADEVKVFNRALSSTEIANEYAAQNAGIASAQTLPTVIGGVSQTALTDAVVRTDAPDYELAISQNNNLTHTDTVTTIAAIAGTIGTPASWVEGTTKGLGFTVNAVTGSGHTIEAKWNGGASYAAVPGAATVFHARNGYTGGGAEKTTLQFRIDTPTAQKSGSYSNTVTFTGTAIP